MPGIRDEHRRAQLFPDMQHVAEQPFLGDQREACCPQRQRRHRRQVVEVLQLDPGAPDDSGAGHRQDRPEGERGHRFDPCMAVRMAFVGRVLAVMRGEEHQEVTDEVGKRMHAVCDQALGMGDDAGDDLGGGQEDIDHDADPRYPLGHSVPGGVVEGDFGRVVVGAHGQAKILKNCWRSQENRAGKTSVPVSSKLANTVKRLRHVSLFQHGMSKMVQHPSGFSPMESGNWESMPD